MKTKKLNDSQVLFWCEACNGGHVIDTDLHKFNDDEDKPSLDGEAHVINDLGPNVVPEHCKFTMKSGKISYSKESTHEKAGKTVDMVDLPEWLTP